MSGFSADWLALREAVDARSRNADLASRLEARFAVRDDVRVVDLGCGTGANLRATSPLLPNRQFWTLIDNDRNLLSEARRCLKEWADDVRPAGNPASINTVHLTKARKHIDVTFLEADLGAGLMAPVPGDTDLVTASALFDLVSADAIRQFVRDCSTQRIAFYTVLTYNGIQHWHPRRPADNALAAAYHRHQLSDKGFGIAAGPMAASELFDAFQAQGYLITEGDSPWELRTRLAGDPALLNELRSGFVQALREGGNVDDAALDRFADRDLIGATVGHTDTLAIPGMPLTLSAEDDEDDIDA